MRQKLYKIFIENLEFETIVGILPNEREQKQKVCINCEIEYIFKKENFIDYAKIATLISSLMKKNQYLLLEEALEDLCCSITNEYPHIKTLKIKIIKPQILPNANVGVEIFKKY
jgi:7,8-dihydroneopterin aldolase/epimerase/oxygenase